jgi:hypothetical protein
MSEFRDPDQPREDWIDAVRAASPEPPLDAVDWDRLHADILRAARPRLERVPTRRWWGPLARWTVPGIPAAAAAVLVLSLGVLAPWTAPEPAAAMTPTIEDELVAGIPDAQLPMLYAGTDVDALLHLVLYYDGEER